MWLWASSMPSISATGETPAVCHEQLDSPRPTGKRKKCQKGVHRCALVTVHACRSLVTTAAGMGGQPWLVSFSGMAQVMGWTHRPPLVAPCSRAAVLQAWQPHCRGHLPLQRFIPFHAVRNMSPAAFVRALAEDLQARLLRCPQPADVLQGLTAHSVKSSTQRG